MQIRELLGAPACQVTAFYEHHDGFVLYQDTLSDTAGIALYPVELWEEATGEMRSTFDYLAEEPERDPHRILTSIAIAMVPESGNYFVMPVEGPSVGPIFYANHDGS